MELTVQTSILPTIKVPLSGGGGPPGPLVQLLKPWLHIDTGISPIDYAPAGRPEVSYWPLVALGTVIFVGGTLALAVLGVKHLLKGVT